MKDIVLNKIDKFKGLWILFDPYVLFYSNDIEFVNDLLDGMFNMKMEDSNIEKLYRLGRWEDGKARPLLVAFRNYEDKRVHNGELEQSQETTGQV